MIFCIVAFILCLGSASNKHISPAVLSKSDVMLSQVSNTKIILMGYIWEVGSKYGYYLISGVCGDNTRCNNDMQQKAFSLFFFLFLFQLTL